MTTISDIAKLAHVLKSTVSRYLNGGYVSKKNRLILEKIIMETNYQVNMYAKALKTKKSGLVAIIVPRLDSFSVIEQVTGINSILQAHQMQTIIVAKNTIEEDELSYIQKMLMQGVDGIILFAHRLEREHLVFQQTANIPIIYMGQVHQEIESIALPDEQIGQMLGEVVQSLSGEEVLYLGVGNFDDAVGVRRKLGFLEKCKKKLTLLETTFYLEDAYKVVQQYFQNNHADIVVGVTDNIAIGALKALLDLNIKVPKQVQVIGVGGYEMSKIFIPSLSTIEVDYQSLGRIAANKLLTKLKKDVSDTDYSPTFFQYSQRKTTK